MNKTALVVIDIQNDITKHYRDIIGNLNAAIDWAEETGMDVVYIKHNNLSAGTRSFKPDTKGAELVPELKLVSDHVFVKSKANALTSEAFSEYIRDKGIDEFYITGADATACVKSTCFNMTKAGYTVHVISDCVTSYDPKKMEEMLAYYADKGCEVRTLAEYQRGPQRNVPVFDGGSVRESSGSASADECRIDRFPIRRLEKAETDAALQLAWKVFCGYEAPDYPPEGTEEFKRCLSDDAYLAGIRYYGAFDAEKLAGMLGIREEKCHICFFFVDGEHQRLGIGTRLFRRMREDFPDQTITLNSSPFGLPFYTALGFTATDREQTVTGIRFTPMEYRE